MDEEEMKTKMDDGVDNSLASEGTDLSVDLLEAPLVSGNQNDIIVSWITL